ncbi:type I polyketide synthase [Ruegeria sp. YS9]|uniref:type I polyketide synthase n=1 Tax=Ruegeria sp. YS9 TaxID=2966453 RepID=UPI00214AE83A|nr:type I polyketide synthase [Ruegeria sp. YS9]UUV08273.1 SDR family NAD(P)-dependent oxidoreductase [Ruegeria sp. YS9]
MKPMQNTGVFVNALACEFPGAHSPQQFHDNLMGRRREFSAMPADRLDLGAYHPDRVGAADSITDVQVALIRDWKFETERFHVPKATFENTDLTHWLALDLAQRALCEIGGIDMLDRDQTAVVVANTLTGEFSRAALTRLRLPFLDEMLAQALDGVFGESEAIEARQRFADLVREAFPDPNEDMLAGGLANTIAGRIANYFDLRGGAYSVDGACASSLVALAHAVSLLKSGRSKHVIVGGVDLSLDPFELVGFSRNGALAEQRMRVFDRRAAGFWPGEGGAMMVLSADRGDRLPEIARVLGWGMSTDGAGGLTRPYADGQYLACSRALAASNIRPLDLCYVEAHGTGTAVGDPTEIQALSRIASDRKTALQIGSVKSNIGHTKAAAGFAGLTKAIMSLQRGVVPAHVGCVSPSAAFEEAEEKVSPALDPLLLSSRDANIIGVSSFGFGGINTHVLVAPVEDRKTRRSNTAPIAPAIDAEAELLLLSYPSREALVASLKDIEASVATITMARLGDACCHYSQPASAGSFRLGFAGSTGTELAAKAALARRWIEDGAPEALRPNWLVANLGTATTPARIGLLFPGQAAPVLAAKGSWSRAFPEAASLQKKSDVCKLAPDLRTDVAQPLITLSNLSGLAVLEAMGIRAKAALGHSLGELAALSACGALSKEEAMRLSFRRGKVMQNEAVPGGAMMTVAADTATTAALIDGTSAKIACENGVQETVVGGSPDALDAVSARATTIGTRTQRLKVSHAFHTPDMAFAQARFGAVLAGVVFRTPDKLRFYSSVSARDESKTLDAHTLLREQLTAPVRFHSALSEMARNIDLLIEVGPGEGMTRLAALSNIPCVALDYGSDSFASLHRVCAAVHVAGSDINMSRLFAGRDIRPFDAIEQQSHLTNPCGLRARESHVASKYSPPKKPREDDKAVIGQRLQQPGTPAGEQADIEAAVRCAFAEETGYAPNKIDLTARFQSQMNMNSLSVARAVGAAMRQLALPVAGSPVDFSDSCADELINYLSQVSKNGIDPSRTRIGGVRKWISDYAMTWRLSAPSLSVNLGDFPAKEILRVPRPFTPDAAKDLLSAIQARVAKGKRDLVVIEDRSNLGGFIRSVWKEELFDGITLIDANGQIDRQDCIDQLCRQEKHGFRHYRLEPGGGLSEPHFGPAKDLPSMKRPDGTTLLAVGCAKGIGLDCAMAMAKSTTEIVFVGRSSRTDADVKKALSLCEERGIATCYLRADITDLSAVEKISRLLSKRGKAPTDLLFAPAVNQPARFETLTDETLELTIAPKWVGLENTLSVFGADLSRVITFGSIIGRIGLQGEAHYALANAMQTTTAEAFAQANHDCAVLSIEWTVWSGGGMGERLGVIDQLSNQGVDALNYDDALNSFEQHLARGTTGTICITSRFGFDTSLCTGQTKSQPSRFLERSLIDFPGVEVVYETSLFPGRDLYLDGHRIDGTMVMPGTAGIEAMGQAAQALTGDRPTQVSDVVFHRPLQLLDHGSSVRIAALRQAGRVCETAIFGSDDGFQEPFATARFFCTGEPATDAQRPSLASIPSSSDRFKLDHLYGGDLFFHEGRYTIGKRARLIGSRMLEVELSPQASSSFGPLEPDETAFWHIEMADAALHLLQLAVPQWCVLPVSIGEAHVHGDLRKAHLLKAIENWSGRGEYCFDSMLYDASDRLLAHIRNARFRRVGPLRSSSASGLSNDLAMAAVERDAREALQLEDLRVALVNDPRLSRAARRNKALNKMNLPTEIIHGANGAPKLRAGGGHISISHISGSTLAVWSGSRIACDLEPFSQALASGVTLDDWLRLELAVKLGRTRDEVMTNASANVVAWLGDCAWIDGRIGIARLASKSMSPKINKEANYA